ncbi:MAG: hypothetical protein K9K38_04965 [Rhodoferax sp.]|nr:hypothetical protein [Rhodoferax sp.]
MSMQSLRLKLAALLMSVWLVACGGGSSAAPPVGGITVVPGDGQVTVTWTPVAGVDYWLFYAPAASISLTDLSKVPNHVDIINVTSPYVVSGLVNGVTYAFAVNGRIDGGPGGPGTPSVAVVPRLAGTVWTSVAAGGVLGSADLRGIAFGSASDSSLRYVAVGVGGAIYQGLDGLNWSRTSSVPAVDLNAVMYTLNQFIAVGAGGAIITSTDLESWTAVSANTTQRLNAVTSNGVLAVAVGDAGTVQTSTDGKTWTAASAVPTQANLYGVNYAATGRWLAVGAGGVMLTSTDGQTWTAVSSGSTANLRAVAVQISTATNYVAVGDGGVVLTSSDGATWAGQVLSPAANLQKLVANYSQLVVVGSGGAVFTSANGSTWTPQVSNTTADLWGLVNAQGQYVAVGKGGSSIYAR